MDYKKIIKNRSTREMILRMLSFVPDRQMVKFQWRVKMGYTLNLNNPKRFTEKLQWYKINYRDPLMKLCADKHDVRSYVNQCGLEHLLNDEYGVYDSPDQVDFAKLPNSFVLKDTLGGGGTSVILVPDKDVSNKDEIYNLMRQWVSSPYKSVKHSGREWVYEGRKHRIVAEKYIESTALEGGLIDWKFFCFQGRVEFLYVISDRELGNSAGLGIYNRDFVRLPYRRMDENRLARDIEAPFNYKEMIDCAEKLAKPFPAARIDLYNISGKILFGEITFFDGSGYMKYEPDEFDFMMGEKFILPEKRLK